MQDPEITCPFKFCFTVAPPEAGGNTNCSRFECAWYMPEQKECAIITIANSNTQ